MQPLIASSTAEPWVLRGLPDGKSSPPAHTQTAPFPLDGAAKTSYQLRDVQRRRFLQLCSDIESELRAIATECRRRSSDLRAVAEKAVLILTDFREERSLRWQQSQDPASIAEGTQSEPWVHVLSVLTAVCKVISREPRHSSSFTKVAFHCVTILQKLLSHWQVLQSSKKVFDSLVFKETSRQGSTESEQHNDFQAEESSQRGELETRLSARDGTINLTDVAVTETPVSIVEACVWDIPFSLTAVDVDTALVALMHLSEERHTAAAQGGAHDAQAVQLKVLGTLLSLFATESPGILYHMATSNFEPNLNPMRSRLRQILAMLLLLLQQSPSKSVRSGAEVGLSQFTQFLADQSDLLVSEAVATKCELTMSDQAILEAFFDYVQLLVRQVAGADDRKPATSNKDSKDSFEVLASCFDRSHAGDLLCICLTSAPWLFIHSTPYVELLEGVLEPHLASAFGGSSKAVPCNQDVLPISVDVKLFQAYWGGLSLHLSTAPGRLLLELLSMIHRHSEPEVDQSAGLGLSFLKWLAEEPIRLSWFFNRSSGDTVVVAAQMMGIVGKLIHQNSRALPPLNGSASACWPWCGDLHLPTQLAFLPTRLSATTVVPSAPTTVSAAERAELARFCGIPMGPWKSAAVRWTNERRQHQHNSAVVTVAEWLGNSNKIFSPSVVRSCALLLCLEVCISFVSALASLTLSFGVVNIRFSDGTAIAEQPNLNWPVTVVVPSKRVIYRSMQRPFTRESTVLAELLGVSWGTLVAAACEVASSEADERGLEEVAVSLTATVVILSGLLRVSDCHRSAMQVLFRAATDSLLHLECEQPEDRPFIVQDAISSQTAAPPPPPASAATPAGGGLLRWTRAKTPTEPQVTLVSDVITLAHHHLLSLKCLLSLYQSCRSMLVTESWRGILRCANLINAAAVQGKSFRVKAPHFNGALSAAWDYAISENMPWSGSSEESRLFMAPSARQQAAASIPDPHLTVLKASIVAVFANRSDPTTPPWDNFEAPISSLLDLLRTFLGDTRSPQHFSGSEMQEILVPPRILDFLLCNLSTGTENEVREDESCRHWLPPAFALRFFREIVQLNMSVFLRHPEFSGHCCTILRECVSGNKSYSQQSFAIFCALFGAALAQPSETSVSRTIWIAAFISILSSLSGTSDCDKQRSALLLTLLSSLKSSDLQQHAAPADWSLVVLAPAIAIIATTKTFEATCDPRSVDHNRYVIDCEGDEDCNSGIQARGGVQIYGTEQSNAVFAIASVLVKSFAAEIAALPCATLLVAILNNIAVNQAMSDNTVFAAIGAMWSLLESYVKIGAISLRYIVIPVLLQKGQTYAFAVKAAGAAEEESAPRRLEPGGDDVLWRVCGNLRRLATDSRVEVRNCAIRTLTTAAEYVHRYHKTQSDRPVEVVVVGALQDVAARYLALLEDGGESPVIDDATHHSRGSALKVWDETFQRILEGAAALCLDSQAAGISEIGGIAVCNAICPVLRQPVASYSSKCIEHVKAIQPRVMIAAVCQLAALFTSKVRDDEQVSPLRWDCVAAHLQGIHASTALPEKLVESSQKLLVVCGKALATEVAGPTWFQRFGTLLSLTLSLSSATYAGIHSTIAISCYNKAQAAGACNAKNTDLLSPQSKINSLLFDARELTENPFRVIAALFESRHVQLTSAAEFTDQLFVACTGFRRRISKQIRVTPTTPQIFSEGSLKDLPFSPATRQPDVSPSSTMPKLDYQPLSAYLRQFGFELLFEGEGGGGGPDGLPGLPQRIIGRGASDTKSYLSYNPALLEELPWRAAFGRDPVTWLFLFGNTVTNVLLLDGTATSGKELLALVLSIDRCLSIWRYCTKAVSIKLSATNPAADETGETDGKLYTLLAAALLLAQKLHIAVATYSQSSLAATNLPRALIETLTQLASDLITLSIFLSDAQAQLHSSAVVGLSVVNFSWSLTASLVKLLWSSDYASFTKTPRQKVSAVGSLVLVTLLRFVRETAVSSPMTTCETAMNVCRDVTIIERTNVEPHSIFARCIIHTMIESLQTLHVTIDHWRSSSESVVAHYQIVAQTLVECVTNIFNFFAADERSSGHCPLPRYRLEEILFVLQRLRTCQIDPIAFAPSNPHLHESPVLPSSTPRAAPFTPASPTSSCLVFQLIPALTSLITVRDLNIRQEVAELLLRLTVVDST